MKQVRDIIADAEQRMKDNPDFVYEALEFISSLVMCANARSVWDFSEQLLTFLGKYTEYCDQLGERTRCALIMLEDAWLPISQEDRDLLEDERVPTSSLFGGKDAEPIPMRLERLRSALFFTFHNEPRLALGFALIIREMALEEGGPLFAGMFLNQYLREEFHSSPEEILHDLLSEVGSRVERRGVSS